MNFNREIEKKYVLVRGASTSSLKDQYYAAIFRLNSLFPEGEVIDGSSTDTFWKQPGTDFIRLRRNTSELSVKISDKGTIEDRLEENVIVKDFDVAQRFATATFGQSVGTLEKNYFVLTMPNFIISLYTVTGDDRLFLEIEADNVDIVTDVAGILMDYFEMKQEHKSLFQLIFGDAV